MPALGKTWAHAELLYSAKMQKSSPPAGLLTGKRGTSKQRKPYK